MINRTLEKTEGPEKQLEISCTDVEMEITAGAKLSLAGKLHLLGCRSCQEFSLSAAILEKGGLPVPDAGLDRRVLSNFKVLSSPSPVPNMREAGGKYENSIFTRHIIFTVAAMALIFLGIWALSVNLETAGNLSTASRGKESVESQWILGAAMAEDELNELELVLASRSPFNNENTNPPSLQQLHYNLLDLEEEFYYGL